MSDKKKPCPNCGHCTECGRSNFSPRPWYPMYPYRTGDFYYQPLSPTTYPQTTWRTNVSSGSGFFGTVTN